MEPLLTELYGLKGGQGPPAQAISGKREAVPWERRGDSLRGEGPYQKKSEQLAQHLLEARVCEKPPAEGAERPGQSGRAGQEAPQQQPAGGREQQRSLQDGVGLEHKEGLQPGSWSLDFESESAHEEIYWGCFYFFPWLRMCWRDKREPS